MEHRVVRDVSRRLAVFGLALGLVAVAVYPVAGMSLGTSSRDHLAFTVTRNGEPIGSHTYRFERQNGRVTVDIRTDIDFRLLSLPVYRFKHQSQEVWDGDRLVRMGSKTDDNGEPVSLDVRADGPVLKIGRDDGAVEVDPRAVPASLWNPVVVERQRLLDTVNGNVLSTTSTDLGSDSLTVGDTTVPAHRFRISGDYHRDLWYDSRDGSLVRVRFEAKDGSEVEYVRAN